MKNFLSGFCIVLALAFSLGLKAAEVCNLEAYVIDPDPKGLNVRAAPDAKSAVLAVIPQDGDGTIVQIKASEGAWLQIATATTIEGRQVYKGKGWVYGPLVGTSTRWEGRDHTLYTSANLKSAPLGKIPGEKELKLQGCSGAWPKVQWKSLQGYLPPDQNCPNPVTTCP